ncbi:MAG: putative tape measure protein [Prokaryotic dsDNA virus sp.]|nr:MAG: putative tape measure protein [Prokaryotic dsDNA virus sp.]|tara:strand:+ start:15324 stop:17231 length:1908 start_codon:yes stop_codon:yes gene_type:complete
MAREELIFSVKSDIKQVTKEVQQFEKSLDSVTKEYNELGEQINIQNNVINDLEKNLIELKAKQDEIPKGAFYKGIDNLNKQIADTTKELKLEKVGLKQLKDQQAQASKEVKKFTDEQKDSNKALEDGVGNFRLFGVSLNDVRATTKKIIPTIKLMFGSIKAGILSTGIGALLIAFGSLATYFTSTKKGVDELAVMFAKLGAAVDVIKDRVSKFGGIVKNFFTGKKSLKESINDTKEAFSGMGEEINKEVKIMGELEKATQRLRDKDNEFMIQKAKTRQEIERARLIAEDETKSAEDRLTNLKKALDLEKQTTDQELELARERVRIQEQQMATSENLVEDEAKLAQLRTQLIETETSSLKMRRRVVTEVNALEREIAAEKKARDEEAQAKIDEKNAQDQKDKDDKIRREKEANDALQALKEENFLAAIEDEKKRALAELEIQKKKEEEELKQFDNFTELKIELDKKYKRAKDKLNEVDVKDEKLTNKQKLDLAKNTFNDLATIAGKESKAGKAAAIAATTISTFQGAQESYKSLAGIPVVGPALGAAAAAAAIVNGFKTIQAIKSESSSAPSQSGGGGSIAQAQTVEAAPTEALAASGAFTLGGGEEPEPVKAFVVADEMTNSQEQLGEIRRNSTL